MGRVRWRPSLHRVDTWMRLTVQLTTLMPMYGQIQLVCPSRGSYCCCGSALHEHTLALPPHRAITSLPLSSRRPCCTHAMHDYKRRPSHCISFTPAPLSTSDKPSPLCSPLFSTTPSVPSHLTPLLSPCAGLGALPDLRAAPQPEGLVSSLPFCSGAVDHARELRFSTVCPPHCDLVPWTMSGSYVEGHGCTMWTPSHGPSSHRPPPLVPRGAPSQRAVHRVDLDVVCPRPALQATPCQVMPYSTGLHPCVAWPSVSCR
jgi:hypothetical protein